MAYSTVVEADLTLLTAALDVPGTDLRDELTLFADQLAAVVPSLLGMTVTVDVDGVAVTLSARDPDLAPIPKATVSIPLSALMADGTMVICAVDVDAGADLAAVIGSFGVDPQVVVGGHSAPPRTGHSVGVSGLAEFSAHNRAIGVLIDQGYCPDEARFEIRRRANRDEVSVDDTVS